MKAIGAKKFQPQGVSGREFSRLARCSHSLIQKAIRQGKLHPLEDGSLDPAIAHTPWRAGDPDGLLTIPRLAVVLQRPKSVIANALAAKPPEGKVGLVDAWQLGTARKALSP